MSNIYFSVGNTVALSNGSIRLSDSNEPSIDFIWNATSTCGGHPRIKDILIDDSSHIIIVGTSTYSGDYKIDLLKYSNSGTLLLNTSWGVASKDEFGYGAAMDSSYNIYVCGYAEDSTGNVSLILCKFNQTLDFQWQRIWGPAGQEEGHDIVIDNNDNIYVIGTTNMTGQYDLLLLKYNTTGDLQEVNHWDISGGLDRGCSIDIDSTGNLYMADFTPGRLFILKYNPDTGFTWNSSTIAVGIYNLDPITVKVSDRNPNQIFLGYDQYTVASHILKYGTDGALLYNTSQSSGSNYATMTTLAIDDESNVFLGGYSYLGSTAYQKCLLHKFDKDGAHQWDYQWGTAVYWPGPSYGAACTAITFDENNTMYLAGAIGSNYFLSKAKEISPSLDLTLLIIIIAIVVVAAAVTITLIFIKRRKHN
jgi:hypothetical protein